MAAMRPHHAPLFCASPRFPGVPCRSASPPSSSPSKESMRDGRNHRRHRRFPCRYRGPLPPNSPLAILLWLNRAHRRPPGEATVLLDPFLLLLPRRSAVSVVTGGARCGHGCPGCCASVA
jgi:hypothetical protein